MKKLFVLGAILSFFVVTASAQTAGDRVRRHRIERGFENLQLTRPEKQRLQRNETRYRVEKRRAARDGRINYAERKRLQKMRQRNRVEAFRLKHNGRRRVI